MPSSSPMSADMSEAPNPVYVSREYLLNVIMEQCGISKEDLKNTDVVKRKIRDSKIETLLQPSL